ncbi:helix-turn-helix transcriptional regulator [Dethiobacter alkaliphilus]|uniref:Transcriptional regulator protein-like protein n=1 Tax=Dethiobacter alkaliphilus AHT 1 TaxID=555088 RepID=C0GGY7_DETAL|nr:WYL domain-containing protein [Dethiobacter alkaliphilus]EEG77289.1 transcriptional regulator protein-like protein [Dethiobacter alkaliphilus AHT 1]
MSTYARNRDYPEALIKILLTIIDMTTEGGATLEQLKDAYEDVRGNRPHKKTIDRAIKRLNVLFDPLAYDNEFSNTSQPIETERENGKLRYRFTRDLASRQVDPTAAFLMALSLYPQQRGMLGDQFEVVMKLVFEEIFSKLATYGNMHKDIEQYVYVTGAGPTEPQKSFHLIELILDGIRRQKRITFQYLRTYDGTLTNRQVEPYGLICRFNNWYLVGRCCDKNGRRIFLLSQIQNVRLVENSIYTIPADFSLHREYSACWGVWTSDKSPKPEKISLRVGKGLAEKFRTTCFHDSQQLTPLPDGDLEVTFRVTGAQEMLPWLLGWGNSIQLLEPAWLVEELKTQLQKTLALY